MPNLPTRDDLGGLPSVRPPGGVASADTTAIGRGIAGIGEGLSQIGQAASNADTLIKAGWRATQAAAAESQFLQFKVDEALALDAAKQSLKPEAAQDFAKTFTAGTTDRAKPMLDKMPDWLRADYGDKTFAYIKSDLYNSALESERSSQKVFVTNNIADTINNVMSPRVQVLANLPVNHPAKIAGVAAAVADMERVIDASPLSETEKAIEKQKAKIQIEVAFGQALPPKDRVQLNPAHPSNLDFRTVMASAESSNNPSIVNDQGYAGLYQFGAPRLADLGVYKFGSGEKPGQTGDVFWQGWSGTFKIPGFPQVKTLEDFLANPAAQDAVFTLHLAHMDQAIASRGLEKYIGQSVAGVTITRNSIYAMMHLGGEAGAEKFLETGGEYNPADANGSSLMQYAQLGIAETGLASAMKDVPFDQVATLVASGEADLKAGDGVAEQALFKSLQDKMDRHELTVAEVEANRENLPYSEYAKFHRAATGASEGMENSPAAYVHIMDMAYNQPGQAVDAATQMFGDGLIDQPLYDKVIKIARDNIQSPTRQNQIGELRKLLDDKLNAQFQLLKLTTQEQEDNLFNVKRNFDQFLADNPDADTASLRKHVDELASHFDMYSGIEARKTLPIPRFATVQNGWVINDEILDAAQAATKQAVLTGTLSDSELADQVDLINRWRVAVANTRDISPKFMINGQP